MSGVPDRGSAANVQGLGGMPPDLADARPGLADARPDLAADTQPGFDADAERHRRDAPRHCPRCGTSLLGGAGISVEFWQGSDRVFHTWCAGCRWTGDIIPTAQMIGHEPEH